jgi:hypothetical protein
LKPLRFLELIPRRLLPYIVPTMEMRRRSILREKDLTDLATADL